MGVARRSIKSMFQSGIWHIVRGDKVQIVAGKDKGQQGIVRKVIRDVKVPRVIVEGRNLSKRHVKRKDNNPGGIITIESPLHYSNVSLVDSQTNKPVRITYKWLEDGTKVRVSVGKNATSTVIPKPESLKERSPRSLPGPKDTTSAEAAKRTVEDGDLPTIAQFQQGIFAFQKQPSLGASKGPRSRPFSTASSNSGSSLNLVPLHPSHIAARQANPSWQGFAATHMWRQ